MTCAEVSDKTLSDAIDFCSSMLADTMVTRENRMGKSSANESKNTTSMAPANANRKREEGGSISEETERIDGKLDRRPTLEPNRAASVRARAVRVEKT